MCESFSEMGDVNLECISQPLATLIKSNQLSIDDGEKRLNQFECGECLDVSPIDE